MQFLLVFLATCCGDVCWTRYIAAVAVKDRWRAVRWNAAIVALGAFTIVSYTANHWLLIPAVLGGALGTYFAVGEKS